MRLVKSKGGYSIGVYDPENGDKNRVYQLYADGRISFYSPADYSAKSELMTYVKMIIDEIAAKEKIRTEQNIMEKPAQLYKVFSQMSLIQAAASKEASKKEKRMMEENITELKEILEEF